MRELTPENSLQTSFASGQWFASTVIRFHFHVWHVATVEVGHWWFSNRLSTAGSRADDWRKRLKDLAAPLSLILFSTKHTACFYHYCLKRQLTQTQRLYSLTALPQLCRQMTFNSRTRLITPPFRLKRTLPLYSVAIRKIVLARMYCRTLPMSRIAWQSNVQWRELATLKVTVHRRSLKVDSTPWAELRPK